MGSHLSNNSIITKEESMKSFLGTKSAKRICKLLIALTPILLTQSVCPFFFGEPKCPDVLKTSLE